MALIQEVGGESPSVAEVSGALERILDGPEFTVLEQPVSSRIFDWVLGKIVDFLAWLFPDITLGAGEASVIFWIVTILLATISALLLLRLLRVRGHGRGERSGVGLQVERSAASRSAEEWESIARDLAKRGRWREAALALYQAVVLRLGETQLLRIHRSKTPGDYRYEIRRKDAATAALFTTFVRLFEPVAFGTDRASPDAYGALADAARRLGSHG